MTSGPRDKGILLETGTNEVEFLRFIVADQTFGINVAKVCQTILLKDQTLTPLPGSPSMVLGTIYFRGKPAPVVDLAQALETTGQGVEPDKKLLLVTEFNQFISAFMIDSVDGIVRCSWSQFVPLDDAVFIGDDMNVVGTVTVDNQIVMILDIEALMGRIIPQVNIESVPVSMKDSAKRQRSDIRIVYCEDSIVVQKVLLRVLNEAGFQNISVFSTGEDGLKFLREQDPGSVDIIISDIEMPRMDGLALCREVRELPLWGKTPFIFFSSMVNEQMRAKCMSVGGTAAYAKPQAQNIVNAIDVLLAHT